jgi:streptomycin 6-kinase
VTHRWPIEVPADLRAGVAGAFGEPGRIWCDQLPRLAQDMFDRWSLTVAGPQRSGFAGVVLPVRRHDESPAMLKLSYPTGDQDLEAEVLAAWDGHGAVRLLDHDLHAQAKLLERLRDHRLFDVESAEAALAVSGALARELATASPPPGVPRLSDAAVTWVEELPRLVRETGYPAPSRVLAAAVATCRELGPDQPDNLLHGDLHGRNILASDRSAWLAVDPVGLAGEVAIECLTSIRDRWTRLRQSSSPTDQLRRQVQVFAEAAGASLDRTVAWTQTRALLAALRIRRSGQHDDDGLHQWVAETLID